MKKENKYLMIFIVLALLPMVYLQIYTSYIHSDYSFIELSDLLIPFSLELVGIVFFIIIVSKYTNNIQYKTYGILLISTQVQIALNIIIFYFPDTIQFFSEIESIVFYCLIFAFVIGSIIQYLKYRNKETILLFLCLIIVRYVVFSGPLLVYIYSNAELWIFYTYYYAIALLVLSISGYVIYKSVKTSEYNLIDNS